MLTTRARSPLFGQRPVLALASASEKPGSKFPNTSVQLYSLTKNKYLHEIRFKSRVLSLACNRRVFVVALHNHIYAFDAVRMDKVVCVFKNFVATSFSLSLSLFLLSHSLKPNELGCFGCNISFTDSNASCVGTRHALARLCCR